MKLALMFVLAVAGCAKASSSGPKTRSVEACERLLKHSLDTEKGVATITLDDHKYQTRKVERQYTNAYEKIRKDPEFLPLCRAITEAEYACMMRATDPYTIEGATNEHRLREWTVVIAAQPLGRSTPR